MSIEKRKICFVITSKIHYSRSKLILEKLKQSKDVDLQIVVGASALLDNYGEVLSSLTKDNFKCNAKITMTLSGGTNIAMAKTAGIGLTEFATVFENLAPDIVILRGDRYEILSAAIAAAYLNTPIAHIEGGDVTGNIDESVRHAVTKLAHIHFPTNKQSHERIIRMGEDPKYVFTVGSSELEFIEKETFKVTSNFINKLGVGDAVNLKNPFLVVMQHPVTSEISANRKHINETLWAIHELGIPTIWFWPNVDAGTDETSKGIRTFRELHNLPHIRFIKYLPGEQFIALLKRSACLVGNSSSGIKECSYLGVPVVNIGSRQDGRMRASNVIDVDYKKEAIQKAIQTQIAHGHYKPSQIYYQKDTSQKIVDTLVKSKLYIQKKFQD